MVYKGQFPNGVKIAVKVLNRNSDRQTEEQFMAEVGTIGRTYHINLVRLYGFCYDQFMSALVYKYLENESLDKYLFSEAREIEWEKLHHITVRTTKGIAYLYEECVQRITHYDIKPGWEFGLIPFNWYQSLGLGLSGSNGRGSRKDI
uniref:Protein kinase domain-containing protein n=1 Tax=Vitis vinifera TaxID=29760 RepID=F6H3B3_VITVI